MLATISKRTLAAARPLGTRALSDARPMTRFIQYPFDKSKMEEVRAWVNESGTGPDLRGVAGVNNVEFSFCPGEGWLAARYIFDDLDDMVSLYFCYLVCLPQTVFPCQIAFPDSAEFAAAKEAVIAQPHYDSSRQPHEFKGFFLPEV
jgi:hypothetical protein